MSRQSNKCSFNYFASVHFNLLKWSILTIFSKPLSKSSCRGWREMDLKTFLLLRYWHNLSTWICTVHTYRERWNYSAFLMLAMSKPTFQIWKNFWNFLRVLAINSRHDLKGWVVVSFNYTCQLVCFYTCLSKIPIQSWIKLNQEQSTSPWA